MIIQHQQDYNDIKLFSLISMRDIEVITDETLNLSSEQELILSYLSLGLSEKQIAHTLNKNVNMIHNQCSCILKEISRSNKVQGTVLDYQVRIKAHLNTSLQKK